MEESTCQARKLELDVLSVKGYYGSLSGEVTQSRALELESAASFEWLCHPGRD
jgi:hypothetical protein